MSGLWPRSSHWQGARRPRRRPRRRPAATSTTQPATPSTTQPDASFPTALFAAMREDPVSEDVADELLAILNDMAAGAELPPR